MCAIGLNVRHTAGRQCGLTNRFLDGESGGKFLLPALALNSLKFASLCASFPSELLFIYGQTEILLFTFGSSLL